MVVSLLSLLFWIPKQTVIFQRQTCPFIGREWEKCNITDTCKHSFVCICNRSSQICIKTETCLFVLVCRRKDLIHRKFAVNECCSWRYAPASRRNMFSAALAKSATLSFINNWHLLLYLGHFFRRILFASAINIDVMNWVIRFVADRLLLT